MKKLFQFQRKDLAGSCCKINGKDAGSASQSPSSVHRSFVATGNVGLAVFIAQHGLAGQFDLVAVLADAFDHDLLAFLQLVADVADSTVGDLRNMQQAVSAREDFDKGPEIYDPAHRAHIGLSDFGFRSEAANTIDGGFGSRAISGSDGNGAVVLDVNLRASFLDEGTNHLAAWSDDVANLIRIDFDLDNSWCIGRNTGSRGLQRLSHYIQNIQPPFLRLLKSFGHYLGVDTGDLNVHLQGGDSIARACNFEIHVAVMILCAGNVAKNRVLVSLHHQSHCHTRD